MKEENIEIINFKLLSVIKSYEEVEKINLNEKYSLENLNLTEISGEAGSGKTQKGAGRSGPVPRERGRKADPVPEDP